MAAPRGATAGTMHYPQELWPSLEQQELWQRLEDQERELEALREQRRDKDAAITFLKTRIATLQNRAMVATDPHQPLAAQTPLVEDMPEFAMATGDADISALRARLQERDVEVEALRAELEEQEQEARTLRECSEEVVELRQRLHMRDEQVLSLGAALEELQHRGQQQGAEELQVALEQNQQLSAALRHAAAELAELQGRLTDRDTEVARLEDQLRAARCAAYQQQQLGLSGASASPPPPAASSSATLQVALEANPFAQACGPVSARSAATSARTSRCREWRRSYGGPESAESFVGGVALGAVVGIAGGAKGGGAGSLPSACTSGSIKPRSPGQSMFGENSPPPSADTCIVPEMGLEERRDNVAMLEEQIHKQIAQHRSSAIAEADMGPPPTRLPLSSSGRACSTGVGSPAVVSGATVVTGVPRSPQQQTRFSAVISATAVGSAPSPVAEVGRISPPPRGPTTPTCPPHVPPLLTAETAASFAERTVSPKRTTSPTRTASPKVSREAFVAWDEHPERCPVVEVEERPPPEVHLHTTGSREAAEEEQPEPEKTPVARPASKNESLSFFDHDDAGARKARQQRVIRQMEQRRRPAKDKTRTEEPARQRPGDEVAPAATPTASAPKARPSAASAPHQRPSLRHSSPQATRHNSPQLRQRSAAATGGTPTAAASGSACRKEGLLGGVTPAALSARSATTGRQRDSLTSRPVADHHPVGPQTSRCSAPVGPAVAEVGAVSPTLASTPVTGDASASPVAGVASLHERFSSLRDEMKRQRGPIAGGVGVPSQGPRSTYMGSSVASASGTTASTASTAATMADATRLSNSRLRGAGGGPRRST